MSRLEFIAQLAFIHFCLQHCHDNKYTVFQYFLVTQMADRSQTSTGFCQFMYMVDCMKCYIVSNCFFSKKKKFYNISLSLNSVDESFSVSYYTTRTLQSARARLAYWLSPKDHLIWQLCFHRNN